MKNAIAAVWRFMNDLGPNPVRVFEKELGGWPTVYRDGHRLVILAPLMRPVKAGRSKGIPITIGFICGLMFVGGMLDKHSPNWWQGIIGGFVVAVVLMPIFRWMYTSTLRVQFSGGGFDWNRGGGAEGRVQPGEDFEAAVPDMHQDAREEIRRQQRSQSKPEAVFQKASQLVIRTGYGRRNWQTVAEIADDERGEKAYLLKTAIEFVAEKHGEELAGKDRQTQTTRYQ